MVDNLYICKMEVCFNHSCIFLYIFSAPKFGTYQQQDSQELLTYLLNALKNEEVHVSIKLVMTSFIYLLFCFIY